MWCAKWYRPQISDLFIFLFTSRILQDSRSHDNQMTSSLSSHISSIVSISFLSFFFSFFFPLSSQLCGIFFSCCFFSYIHHLYYPHAITSTVIFSFMVLRYKFPFILVYYSFVWFSLLFYLSLKFFSDFSFSLVGLSYLLCCVVSFGLWFFWLFSVSQF